MLSLFFTKSQIEKKAFKYIIQICSPVGFEQIFHLKAGWIFSICSFPVRNGKLFSFSSTKSAVFSLLNNSCSLAGKLLDQHFSL